MSDSEIARHPGHRRRGRRRRRNRLLVAILVGIMFALLLGGALWLINRSSPAPQQRQPVLFP